MSSQNNEWKSFGLIIMRDKKCRMGGGWHKGEGAPQRMLAPGATNPHYATAA